jgi:hypothetical protein
MCEVHLGDISLVKHRRIVVGVFEEHAVLPMVQTMEPLEKN